MRVLRIPLFTLAALVAAGCGRKGDPIPRVHLGARAPEVRWSALRRLEVTLPTRDAAGDELVGLEQVRLLWLPVGLARPTAPEVFARGEVVLERRRPDLPKPGAVLSLDLSGLKRPAGWLVVVAVRGGEVAGQPSEVLTWLDPNL